MPTARIVLSSLQVFERPIPLRQSLHFTLPIVHLFPGLKSFGDNACCLSGTFIALKDTTENGYWSFMSVYHLSKFFMDRIYDLYGPLAAGVQALSRNPLLDMFICQGYLHSNLSPEMTLQMEQRNDSRGGKIHIAASPHGAAIKTARGLIRRLSGKVRRCGVFPIGGTLDANMPGRGNHVGGTFPMRHLPDELECDTLGRPGGLSRVHIVDASVLPSIPATTITIGVMANAHRIAKASCTL